MRLICPNCGAQYEVDARLIPPGGRDLECSNCGHAWFERPGASEAAEAEDEALATEIAAASHEMAAPPPLEDEAEEGEEAALPDWPEVVEVAPEDPPPPPRSQDPAPVAAGPDPGQDEHAEASADRPAGADQDADEDSSPDDGRRMPLRTVAPEIAEILRQEAEREQAARRAEAEAGIETQPDLGLDQLMADEERRAAEARERLARLRGTPTPAAAIPTPAPAPLTAPVPEEEEQKPEVTPSRRRLLPDIEEINSTLSSAPARPSDENEDEVDRRRGFRLGFGSILLVAALLALAYAFAPEIVATVPQTEPVLAPYVAAIDDGRIWLDQRLQDLLTRMEEPPEGG